MASAVAVGIGSSVQCNLANSAATDYFKVQLVAGQKYTFQVVLGTLYDSILTLMGGGSQSVIAQNDGMGSSNRTSAITWSATGSGVYYLVVSSFPGTPDRALTLSAAGPATSASTRTPSPASPSSAESLQTSPVPSAPMPHVPWRRFRQRSPRGPCRPIFLPPADPRRTPRDG